MLKKTLQIAIALFLIGNSSFAQVWGGSIDVNGDTYRNGNVGIGTTTPTAQLTVSTGGPIISLFKHTGTANAAITVANNTGFMNLGIGATTPHPYIWSNTGKFFIGDDANPTMFIGMGNGNVGIGTSAPASKLDINITSGTGTTPQYGLLLKTASFSTEENATNSYFLKAMDEGNQMTAFIINGKGNVGIGTDNPSSFKLAVEGSIAAREILVTLQTPFPDYVFNSNYDLRNLDSLENFINKNKHLPGIPSATDVQKDGRIPLGEMNNKLLEKIEELTLYIIELNKKVQKLEQENKEIKKEQVQPLN